MTTLCSMTDVSAALDAAAQSSDGEAARVEWARYLSDAPARFEDAGAHRELFSAHLESPTELVDSGPKAVESAFIAALMSWSGGEHAVDVEWDLRTHLEALHADSAGLPGSLTAVYPRLVSRARDSSMPIAPWHDLVRYQSKRGSRTFRGVPNAGVLLTRLFGRPVDPAILEGFEPLYAVVARYTITARGTDLHILGPVGTEALLESWAGLLS
jgi:hypothetical protein